jgi:hypothetical protein
MSKLMRTLIVSSFIFLFAFSLSAQSECSYYHKKECANKEGVSMKYDSQSKSAVLGKGQISEFYMVAYQGLDYRITLCAEEILGEQVQFKIYEKQRILIQEEGAVEQEEGEGEYDAYSDAYSEAETGGNDPQFKVVKELLYDNATDNYSKSIEFSAEGSMSLIVEVSIPGESGGSKLKIREMGCVGVLIEHAKSRKAGF